MENGARPAAAAGAHWLAAAPPNFRAGVVQKIMKNLAQIVRGDQLQDCASRYEAKVFSHSDNAQDYLRTISKKIMDIQQRWQPAAASELEQQQSQQMGRHQLRPVDALVANSSADKIPTSPAAIPLPGRPSQVQSMHTRVAQLHPRHPTAVTQIQNSCPARQNSTQQPQPRMTRTNQQDLRVDQRQTYQTQNGQHANVGIMQTRQCGGQQLGSPHLAVEVDWREDMFQKITSLKDAHSSELAEFARALQACVLHIGANGQLVSSLQLQKTNLPEVAKDQLDKLQTTIYDLLCSYRGLKARTAAKKSTGFQSQDCPEPPQVANMSSCDTDDNSQQNHHEQHAAEALSHSSQSVPSGTPVTQQENHSDHFLGEAEDNSVRDEAESPVAVNLPGDIAPFTGTTCSQETQQMHPADEAIPQLTQSVEPAGTSPPAQQQTHSAHSVSVEAEDDSVRAEAERPVSTEVLIKRAVDAARSLSPAALRSLASDMGVNLKRAFRHTMSDTMDGSSCVWFDDESRGESCYKRQKTHDYALLDEIRATYSMLVETEIRISEDDTGGAGTVIEFSYNAVSLAPNLKAAICPSGVSTKLLVPADYPQSSPVILGVVEQRKGVQRVVDMAFRRALDLLPEPRSIEGMAKAWDSVVRRAIVRFAHQFGGGTFSSRYGGWESCIPVFYEQNWKRP